jgi:hypothetical protein
MFRMGGVILGCGVGAGLGWAASRIFTRSIVQDISASLAGWLLGSVIVVAAELAGVMVQAPGGLGAVSAGTSEVVLFGLPIAVLLAVTAQWARRRVGHVTVVPVVLGGLGALLGALWVTTSISVSGG